MSDPASPSTPAPRVYRVAELLSGVRQLLEDRVGTLWVCGELSNLHRASSGHSYFSLKDDSAQVRAVLFRMAASRIPFEIEEGMEVLVQAQVTVYEPRGDLQLIVRHIEPRGQGALQLALEQLRRRLEAEGLFEDARKRPLPAFPSAVGVVTSPTGAAVRDVIQVASRLFPRIPLRLVPTRVQGEGADEEIAAALEGIGEVPGIEVVLLVRGGGSLEDLWSFNSERVVRAVVACPVPVVTGVGHEVDFTLVDAAADLRAPTPSAAAAAVLPDRDALRQQIRITSQRLLHSTRVSIARARARSERELAALRMLAPGTKLAAQRARMVAGIRGLGSAMKAQQMLQRSRLGEGVAALHRVSPGTGLAAERARTVAAARGLEAAIRARQGRQGSRLGELVAALDSLSPLAVLARGYAVARRKEDGAVIERADQVKPGETVSLRVARARIEATINRVEPLD